MLHADILKAHKQQVASQYLIQLLSVLYQNRYDLMYQCWKEDPTARPAFTEIVESLEVIQQNALQDCSLLATSATDASKSTVMLCSGANCQPILGEDQTLTNATKKPFHNSPASSSPLQETSFSLEEEESSDCYTQMNSVQETKCSPLVIANGLNTQTNSVVNPEYANTPPQHSILHGANCQPIHGEDQTLTNATKNPFHNSPASSSPLQETSFSLEEEESSDCYTQMNSVQETKCSPLVIANGLNTQTNSVVNPEYANTPPQHSILHDNNVNGYPAFS